MVGPAGKHFYDAEWRQLDLPHDYLAESDIREENLISHGYRTRDNAWYRKSFLLDKSLEDRELFLVFEGTAVNATFYFNGSLMARSFSAYTETVINITDRAYFDGRVNTLAVYINGLETEGWWYEGAGIYRHVRLYAKDKLHIAHNGIFAKPVLKDESSEEWCIEVEATVENSAYDKKSAAIRTVILDGEKIIAEDISDTLSFTADKKAATMRTLTVKSPKRWDVDSPNLYTVRVELISGDGVLDEQSERIGFRTFFVDAERGFFLNGRSLKIKGTCNHQDHAGVGVAVPDSIQYYRIKLLKELGTNAYRCSHNLPSKEVLDACDELGLIVMDENRRFESRDEVLEYLDIMVKRDRNHPSVIFWSLFNEEPLQNSEEGAKIYRRMRSRVESLDNSRLITGAINGNLEGAGLLMDIAGINYCLSTVDIAHKKHPSLPVIGSENNSAVTTRGCYKSDREISQALAGYDEEAVPWGNTVRDNWAYTRARDFYAGIFIWTGFDYRGEPTPFSWPSVSSQFGIMDSCGFKKDSYYFNKACFTDEPMIHILPHWNFSEGECVRVMAVTNCDAAELYLNGRLIGRKEGDLVIDTPEWLVDFEPGVISAKGYKNGTLAAVAEQKTAGEPFAVSLSLSKEEIKNDGQDTVAVNVSVVDRNGTVVPYAENTVHFNIIGDGRLLGVGNGNPNSHESDTLPKRRAFAGMCQALVSSNLGAKELKVKVHSDGLMSAVADLAIKEVQAPLIATVAKNSMIDGFTVSEVTSHRPDPCVVIADNDMNSFVPIDVTTPSYQEDFTLGYRIYRVQPLIFGNGCARISFSSIRFDELEIYVNGALINKEEFSCNGEFVSSPFTPLSNEKNDIRILIHIKDTTEWGAGIAKSVYLIREDN